MFLFPFSFIDIDFLTQDQFILVSLFVNNNDVTFVFYVTRSVESELCGVTEQRRKREIPGSLFKMFISIKYTMYYNVLHFFLLLTFLADGGLSVSGRDLISSVEAALSSETLLAIVEGQLVRRILEVTFETVTS